MTDISKCDGIAWTFRPSSDTEDYVACPIRHRCYRYTAPVGERQSFMAPAAVGKDCADYLEVP